MTQAYDKAIKPSGLRATQFSLLTVVAKLGPVGIKDLAKALVMVEFIARPAPGTKAYPTEETVMRRRLNPP